MRSWHEWGWKIGEKLLLLAATGLLLVLGWGALNIITRSAGSWTNRSSGGRDMLIGFGGFVVFLLLLAGLRRWRTYRFLNALDHELMHAFFGILTGAGVEGLAANDPGSGHVVMRRPNFIAVLAPYLLCVPLLFVFVLASVVSGEYRPAVNVVMGATFAYHLSSLIINVRPHQRDFGHTTFPIGLLWVIAWTLCLMGLVTCLAIGGWAESFKFLHHSWQEGRSIL